MLIYSPIAVINRILLFLLNILLLSGVSAMLAADPPQKRFIVGQDLDGIRGYMRSGCCRKPDATTAYLSFYNIMDEDHGYGGIGIDEDGVPLDLEWSWGAGPVNAYKTGKEFGIESLAIGLSFTENERPDAMDDLVAGRYDGNIRQLGRFARLFDGAVYLRVGYEFDGMWNHGYENAAQYKSAYRRIVDKLREDGVDNVEYVWQASASQTDEILDARHENIMDWYPGDDYVDWLGFSLFAHPQGPALVPMAYEPATPAVLIQEVLDVARRKNKPVMIAEAAPRTFDLAELHKANHIGIYDGAAGEGRHLVTVDDIWAAYFGPLFQLMKENGDVIRALAYINTDWDAQSMWGPPYPSGYWGDSRLEANPELSMRFNAAIDRWLSEN